MFNEVHEERDDGFKNVLGVSGSLLTLLEGDGPGGLQSSLYMSIEENVPANLPSCS